MSRCGVTVWPSALPQPRLMIFALPMFYGFDNYEEINGDFTKKLAPDYNFLDYGYRVLISRGSKPIGIWRQFREFGLWDRY